MARTDIPSTYGHASKIGPDGRAVFAAARLVWDSLTPTMQRAMVSARASYLSTAGLRVGACREPTRAALVDRGLLGIGSRGFELTPLGLLVREVGTRTGIDPDDEG